MVKIFDDNDNEEKEFWVPVDGSELTDEEIERLAHDKLVAEAEDRDRDIAEGWEPPF